MYRLQEKIKENPVLYPIDLSCRLILALVFFYGGATKIGKPQAFAEIIGAYGILPDSLVLPTAYLLPPLEIAAAIGLLLAVRMALVTTTLFMAMFILVLFYGIWLGLDIDCGCFDIGSMEHQVFDGLKGALMRDLLLLLPLGMCWFFEREKSKTFELSKGEITNA